jgi:hypothetical protein
MRRWHTGPIPDNVCCSPISAFPASSLPEGGSTTTIFQRIEKKKGGDTIFGRRVEGRGEGRVRERVRTGTIKRAKGEGKEEHVTGSMT